MTFVDFSDTIRYCLRNDFVSGIQKVVCSILNEHMDVHPCIIDWSCGDVYFPEEDHVFNWDVLKSISLARGYVDYSCLISDKYLKLKKISFLEFKGHNLIFLGGPWNFENSSALINKYCHFNNVKIFVHDLLLFKEQDCSSSKHREFITFFENLGDNVKYATSSKSVANDISKYLNVKAAIIPFPAQFKLISGNWSYNAGMNAIEEESYFLSIGSIDGRKNHAEVINHWIDSGMVDNYKLFIVGAKKTEDPNFEMAMARVEKNIYYLGVIDDVMNYRLMMSCKGVIYPSRFEGFGLPVLEAYIHNKRAYIPMNSNFKEMHSQFIEYNDNIRFLHESGDPGYVGPNVYSKSWAEFINFLKELK